VQPIDAEPGDGDHHCGDRSRPPASHQAGY
jgi:hypothetical protein